MKFEWDEIKNQTNISEHEGVSFDNAIKVFEDIWAIDEDDSDHSTDENRFTIIGLAEMQILRVTYTALSEETEEVIRIISARKAKGKDKRNYEQAKNELDI